MTPDRKQEVLAHCLWMAARDPEYAIWAAGWYEANEPELLVNLQAKVQQEVKRASASSSTSAPAPASTTGSTGARRRKR